VLHIRHFLCDRCTLADEMLTFISLAASFTLIPATAFADTVNQRLKVRFRQNLPYCSEKTSAAWSALAREEYWGTKRASAHSHGVSNILSPRKSPKYWIVDRPLASATRSMRASVGAEIIFLQCRIHTGGEHTYPCKIRNIYNSV
jgi:hypothetical protein